MNRNQAACSSLCPRAGARGGARACSPRWVRMRSSPRRLEDRSDDLQLTAAVRAVLEVDLEDTLEQPGPAHSRRLAMRAAWLGRGTGWNCGAILLRPCRNHHRAQLGVRRQHAMEADQVQARPRHQRCQPLYELQATSQCGWCCRARASSASAPPARQRCIARALLSCAGRVMVRHSCSSALRSLAPQRLLGLGFDDAADRALADDGVGARTQAGARGTRPARRGGAPAGC